MSDPVSYLQAMDDAACLSCETRKRLEAELQPFLEQEAQEIASHEAIMKDRGLTECTTFGPAAIKRIAEREERRQRDPDFILPLSEYKALQARVVAAELALAGLKEYAGETFDLWDKDKDSKVGKRLMWMSGKGNRNYEPDLEHIHAVSSEAVRELIEKAEQVGAIKDIASRAYEAITGEDIADPTPEQWNEAWAKGNRLVIEADTLRTRLRESEALVEANRSTFHLLLKKLRCGEREHHPLRHPLCGDCQALALIDKALTLTPADALAGYRDEVLEEVAKRADEKANTAKSWRDKCTVAGTLEIAGQHHAAYKAMLLFAAEIRAMKATEKGGTR